MKPLGSVRVLTRSKRGQALLAMVAVAGGVGIGVVMSVATHPNATAAAPFEITPSANVIGSPLQRQPTPSLAGLTDQNGKVISLSDEKGHVVLLAFMDPLCVNLCPTLGRDIVALEQDLPKGINPVLLIVSDVSGRTPADVQHFVSTNLTTKWLAGWHWLIGPSDAALKLTWQAWGEPLEPPKTNYLDVIDPQGYLRVTYPAPLVVGDVVSAVTTVAHE
jgi:cytochrome oxidase Cu insertion factor (SCO1/SenC/PrrC family)